MQTQPSAVRFPGGESMTEMSARVVQTIRRWDAKIAAEHGDDAVWAAVSHGDPIKAILADALGLHLDSFQRIMVDPASLSMIRYTATRPYVVTTNSTNADLGKLLTPPPKKAADDAATPRRTTPRSAGASVPAGTRRAAADRAARAPGGADAPRPRTSAH